MIIRSEIMKRTGRSEVISLNKIQEAIVQTHLIFSDGASLYLRENQRLFWKLKPATANIVLREKLFAADAQSEISRANMEKVLENLLVDTRIIFDLENINPPRYINFKNGVYDLIERTFFTNDTEVEEAIKNLFFSYEIDANYISQEHPIKQMPKFLSFVQKTFNCNFGDNTFSYLLANLGYLLSSVNSLRKAIIFMGAPASGKSTLADFIGAVVLPKSEVSHISFHDLGHRFRLYEAGIAKLNISNEINKATIRNLANFKSLTAGEEIVIERKGKDPVVVKPNVRQLYCTNYLPNFDDGNAAAVFDRLNLVIFRKTINEKERNPTLLQDFLAERDGILSRAVENFAVVLENKIFEVPKSMANLKNEFIIEENSVEIFIRENLIENTTSTGLSTMNVFEKYQNFCAANGFAEKSKKDLRTGIMTTFPAVTITRKRLTKNLNVRVYLGVDFKEDE